VAGKEIGQARQIHGGGHGNIMKMGLGVADVTGSAQAKGTDGPGESTFNASPPII